MSISARSTRTTTTFYIEIWNHCPWVFQRTINHIHTTPTTGQICLQSWHLAYFLAAFWGFDLDFLKIFRQKISNSISSKSARPTTTFYFEIWFHYTWVFSRTTSHIHTAPTTGQIFLPSWPMPIFSYILRFWPGFLTKRFWWKYLKSIFCKIHWDNHHFLFRDMNALSIRVLSPNAPSTMFVSHPEAVRSSFKAEKKPFLAVL